jgi:hypothetical protein
MTGLPDNGPRVIQSVAQIRETLEDMRRHGLKAGLPQEHAWTLLAALDEKGLQWHRYPGSAPAPNTDGRALCWIETGDGMAYIGLRMYRGRSDGEGSDWYSGGQIESGNITHWMPLPQPPWVPPVNQ